MSIVKIFLPENLFYEKNEREIYGEIQINENAISYFVISDENHDELRHLGFIAPVGRNLNKDVSMNFAYDSFSSTIYLTKLNIKTSSTTVPNIFLYNANDMVQLYCPTQEVCKTEQDPGDIRMLYNLLASFQKKPSRSHQKQAMLSTLFTFTCECIHRTFSILNYQPFLFFFKRMALCEHYTQWKIYKSRKRLANMILDKVLGMIVMIILLFFVSTPGDNLIKVLHIVIHQLRQLLGSLKGSPIGLKLNIHLNHFFLDCFTYHVDLWATFLELIESIVRQLFVPVALLGLMGFSFQLAMLADLISLVGLHAYSFYIYAAVLYKVEIKGLQVLLKVVLGKRHNPLKNRVESHEYMNRQLYLATIFFTSLVFLLPTILVYYIVFTTLRLIIYLATLLLKIMQKGIFEFPLDTLIKWSCGRFYKIDSLHLQHIDIPVQQNFMKMSVFKINIKSSSLSHVFSSKSDFFNEIKSNEEFSLKRILTNILKGTI